MVSLQSQGPFNQERGCVSKTYIRGQLGMVKQLEVPRSPLPGWYGAQSGVLVMDKKASILDTYTQYTHFVSHYQRQLGCLFLQTTPEGQLRPQACVLRPCLHP